MKRIYLLGITVLLLGQIALADSTFVSGAVRGNWTREGSPYIIENYLIIETGDTLSIGPGVRVYFEGPYYLRVDSAAVFHAIGAEGDSIVFTGLLEPDTMRWGGIECYRCGDTVRFEYCVIEHATGIEFNPAVELYRCNQSISHCSFRENDGRETYDVHGGALGIISSPGDHSSTSFIRDCKFENNIGGHGGAVGLRSATGEIARCIFTGNHATSGGALYDFGSQVEIRDCEFYNNTTDSTYYYARGGAIWYEGNHGFVVNCLFVNNYAHGMGGAIADPWGSGSSTPQLRYSGNKFIGNRCDSLGGALVLGRQEIVQECLFDSNQAWKGGAIYYHESDQSIITRNTFTHNIATHSGAAIKYEYGHNGNLRVVNNVIAYNSGSMAIEQTRCVVNYAGNNAFWENELGNWGNDLCETQHFVLYTNSNGDSCDWYYNLYLDPLLVDAANGDYHLQENSPLIDAGIAGQIFSTVNDPDGTPPDIGAFYFDQTSSSDELPELPSEISLSQNYPNPFNSETTIEFEVPTETRATLELFDITGRQVQTLFDGLARGTNSVHVSMKGMSSGIYVYRLSADARMESQKMLFIK